GSHFFLSVPLQAHGLEWIEPPAMLAHPFDDGTCSAIYRSVERTASGFEIDAAAYRRLIGTIVKAWPQLEGSVLGPVRWPRHPMTLARFGSRAMQSAEGLASRTFRGQQTRAVFAGIAAHGMLPLDRLPSAAFGIVLDVMAH